MKTARLVAPLGITITSPYDGGAEDTSRDVELEPETLTFILPDGTQHEMKIDSGASDDGHWIYAWLEERGLLANALVPELVELRNRLMENALQDQLVHCAAILGEAVDKGVVKPGMGFDDDWDAVHELEYRGWIEGDRENGWRPTAAGVDAHEDAWDRLEEGLE